VRSAAETIVALAVALGVACGRPDAGPPTPGARCDPGPPRPDGLVVAGSGSNIAIVREIAKRWTRLHPAAKIRVPESIGSGGALRALGDRAIDVGLTSRALTEREKAGGLVETVLARVPLAAVVHPEARVAHVTSAELTAIYRGERDRWPDGTAIVPLLREPGDSGNDLVAQAYPELWAAMSAAMRAGSWTTCYTDQELADTIAETEGAVGFLDVGTLRLTRPQLRPLPLDGAEPTPERAVDGTYRLVKTLWFVTAGPPAGDAEGFIRFATSSGTSPLLASAGYLPPTPR
jgi:phosphate transport system substrate-binding protein